MPLSNMLARLRRESMPHSPSLFVKSYTNDCLEARGIRILSPAGNPAKGGAASAEVIVTFAMYLADPDQDFYL